MSKRQQNRAKAYLRFLESKIKGAIAIDLLSDRDWLFDQYITHELDCVQIGKLLNRDPKTVWYWLKKHAIPTRPRGSYHEEFLPKGQRVGFRHSAESKAVIRDASIARGAVPYLRDGQHWLKGQSGSINPNWKGGITPERQEFYRSPEWKHAVVEVWERENACCQRCGLDYRTVDRKTERFHVHHIIPFVVKELRAEPYNLALLCRDCHNWIHSKANVTCLFLAVPVPVGEVQIEEVAA